MLKESRIRVLKQDVVNQIAAGEVVERSASVVKELVENALDAGAKRVDVETSQGGRKLIRVVDDGQGMTAEEAELCVVPHATSKLTKVDDLWTLSSMGFRGEALPSIAAVCRLTIATRPPEEMQGYRITMEGGALTSSEPIGKQLGTTVEAKDLFYNTPARLKFLKSTATEAAHIYDTLCDLALAHPEVHFTLTQDGRLALDLPACQTLLDRSRAVLGKRLDHLFCADYSDGDLSIEACLSPPGNATRATKSVHLLVNRRAIRDRSLVHAVSTGYGELLEKGRFPLTVIHIKLKPVDLDVNVHPQKVEVRFLDPHRVFGAVKNCVTRGLSGTPWIQGNDQPLPARVYTVKKKPAGNDTSAGFAEHKERVLEATRRFWSRAPQQPQLPNNMAEALASYEARISPSQGAGTESGACSVVATGTNPEAVDGANLSQPALPWEKNPDAAPHAGEDAFARGSLNGQTDSILNKNGYFAHLKVIGQILDCFLICEGTDELVLVDQHAAHERITFERLRRALEMDRIPSQRLLIPATMDLEPQLAAIAEEQRATLEQLGLELEEFGGKTWTVRAIPSALNEVEPQALARCVLEELAELGVSMEVKNAQDRILAKMACHGSVRAGRRLEEQEMKALLTTLSSVDFSAHCPHGRPVMVRFSRRDIEKQFGRT